MIILNNKHDKHSRDWTATYAQAGDVVLDWYDPDELQQWLDAGGTLQVSAFPSTVENVEAHDLPEFRYRGLEGERVIPARAVAAFQDVLRTPANRAESEARAAKLKRRVALAKKAVPPGGGPPTANPVELMELRELAYNIQAPRLTITPGQPFSITLEWLGDLSKRAQFYFNVRGLWDDPEDRYLVQIEETAGLMRIGGSPAPPASKPNGTLTVTDVVNGYITVTLAAVETAKLWPTSAVFGVRKVPTGESQILLAGFVEID